MGPRNVGFLSGNRIREPKPTDDTIAKNHTFAKPLRVRVCFLLSGSIVIIFAIFCVTQGLSQLQSTTDSAARSVQGVHDLTDEAQSIVNDLIILGKNNTSTRDDIVSALNVTQCPYGDLSAVSGQDLSGQVNQLVTGLDQLSNFVDGDLTDLKDTLSKASDAAQSTEDAIDQYEVKTWHMLLFVIPYLVLTTLMMIGVALAWMRIDTGPFQCILSWVVLPLFIIFVVITWICTSLFGVTAVMNADTCLGGTDPGSPQGTFLEILAYQNYPPENLVYKGLNYYLTRCQAEPPFQFVEDYKDDLTNAYLALAQAIGTIDEIGVDNIAAVCGSEFVESRQSMGSLAVVLKTLSTNAGDALDLLACNRIYPVIVTSLNDFACDYTAKATTWAFAGGLIVAFFGMIMITLRAAYLDVLYYDEQVACDKAMPMVVPTLSSSRDDNPPYAREDATLYDRDDPTYYDHGYPEEDEPMNNSKKKGKTSYDDEPQDSNRSWERYPTGHIPPAY